MNRRRFLQAGGALSAASLLSAAPLALHPPSKYPMGLQLFSIHDAMVDDAVASLRAIAKMGYRDV